MILTLQRERSDLARTFGVLFVNGIFQCFTLEDPVRPQKVPGHTAVPAGRYPLVLTYSPRFKRTLPLLLHVPEFEGVRIHVGNTENDTEGCILPGTARSSTALLGSRLAFDALYEKLVDANNNAEDLWLLIKPVEGISS